VRFTSLKPLLLPLLLVVLCALAYAPVRHHRFIQDDHPIVQRNPIVHRGDAVEIFRTDWWAGVGGGDPNLYRPVTIWSYTLERGGDGKVVPERAHVTNVALHALVSCLLLWLARRLGADPFTAGAAALLFAVHPIHVAAVAPLTGRAEILALLFSLAALVCHAYSGGWSDDPPRQRRIGRLAAWGTGVCLFLALGSKEAAFATPPLLLLLDAFYRRPRDRAGCIERVRALAPAVIAGGVHLAFRAGALGALVRTQQPAVLDNPLLQLEGVSLLATRLGIAGRYLFQLVFPLRLSADYSGGSIPAAASLLAPLSLLGLLGLLGLGLLVVLAWRGRPPWSPFVGFAALAYLLPFLVIGNLLVSVGVIYAERLIYSASAGFCLLAALALSALRRGRAGRTAVAALAALLVVAGAWHTHRESRHWKNEETLFRAALVSTPSNPRAHFTLGKILVDRAARDGAAPDDPRYEEALDHFARTLELWPAFWSAHYERGAIRLRRGEIPAALDAFRAALRIRPEHGESRFYVGMILRRSGHATEAERELRETLRVAPWMGAAMVELGDLLTETGRPGEAAHWYREARRHREQGLADAR
jgi:tetratricopeptide (TPR) repeat protein